MSLVEFIGFVITFMAMSILFGKKSREERKRRQDPEGYEREQRAKKEMLEKMYGGLMNIPAPPPEEEEEPHEEEVVHFQEHAPPLRSEQEKITKKRLNKREMVILATIYGPPKGKLSKN